MGDKGLGEGPDDEQSSYKVICFVHGCLPDQYLNLVLSKWLRSLKFGNDYFRLIDDKCYYKAYQTYIIGLLTKSVVRLAVLSDDRDVVLGFSVSEGGVVHYVHVHKDQRRQGIGRSLLPSEFHSFTHITKTACMIWPKFPKAIFNPFA